MSDGTSTSYQVCAETPPSEPIVAASAAGAVFQVTLPSVQLVSATRWSVPPTGEPSTQKRRSLALVTFREPTPATANFSSMFLIGLLSATIVVVFPKFEAGRSDWT